MFDENEKFSYSIDVAATIYKSLKTQKEADEMFYKQLELFFQKIGHSFTSFKGAEIMGIGQKIYKSEEQTITVLTENKNQSAVYAVMLSTNDTYTQRLFKEGLSNKCLFGLPIFTMQWWDDFNKAYIYFMTRDAYLKYDTPQGRLEKELLGF
jgi:hypothetical protein